MSEIQHTFESPAALYAAAGNARGGRPEFMGATVHDIHARRWGWAEAVKMLEALPEWKAPPAPGGRWVKTWNDYDGDELDPERLYAGAPCLARRVKQTGQRIKGVARVYVNVCENADIKADKMLWKTYAAARLVDSMEAAGQRCEIYAAFASIGTYKEERRDGWICTKIKSSEEPLNVALCLNVFSPWMLRYWYFAIINKTGKAYSHKGSANSINGRSETAGAYIIDTGECLSKDAAARFIEQHTNKPTGARS